MAKEVLVPCRGSSQNPTLKTEVVHNIVAVGSTTPPPPFPTFFSPSRSPSRAPARRILSSIKAEGIDGEMIEHCAPQCSSMYRPALSTQSEYVVHRSNWTMIDDVTFLSPLLLFVSSSLRPCGPLSPSLCFSVCFSLFLAHSFSLSLTVFFPTSRGSNPPQAEHRTGDAQSSRLFPSFSYFFVFLFSSRTLLVFPLFLSFSFSFYSVREFSFTLSLFLSLSFSFSLSISLYYFDLLPLPNTSFVPIFILILPPWYGDTLLQDP